MRDKSYFKSVIRTFPLKPGVYIMKNQNQDIIYIGKAKKLKNRVSSYFNNNIDSNSKVGKMVNKIYDIDYIVTNSELEALVLESNLIKKYKPLYNILLKDDKGYKFIKISPPPYSRITVVSKKQNDNSIYIGPYMSNLTANQIVQSVCKIFKLPTCNRDFLNRDRYERPCLNYYINLCCAPCCGKISLSEYQNNIEDAVKYLKAGMKPFIKELKEKMLEKSQKLEFEVAAQIRDQIKKIEQVNEPTNVIISEYENIDVLAVFNNGKYICATLLIFRDYKLIDKKQYLMNDDENLDDVRKMVLIECYSNALDKPDVLYIDDKPKDFDLLKNYLFKNTSIILHTNKSINKIMNIAQNNSRERILQEMKLIDKDIVNLNKLKELLKLTHLPRRIEAYDISNFGSQIVVGAMVVFVDGQPKKSLYRKFKIKDVLKQNDYKSMEEVLERRLKRYLLDEDESEKNVGFSELPDLMLIDGGSAHVNVASLVLSKYKIKIPVYGMVKDESHTTDALVNLQHEKIEIKNDKDIFLFIKRIQDEIHRFTITYSRKSHKITSLKSSLLQIPGIGEARQKKLIETFKTIDAIKNASEDDLITLAEIPRNTAKEVLSYIKENLKEK